jgi:D-beta-D-heptose 7-phosphate kinase/D-beta-D-heptose 1-phosphate adenosyltransferase
MISAVVASNLLKKIAGLRVLVIGDVMLDHYLWGDATRISPEAPVPVVEVARDTYTAGGAANVALNIAALGGRCTVAGFFGQDEAGEQLTQILRAREVGTLYTPGKGATIVKTRVMVQHQQLCRLDREGPPSVYRIEANQVESVFGNLIGVCQAVVLSDYAKGVLSSEVIAKITELAHAQGKFVALDPKPRRSLTFRDLDLITPNRREALQLAGIEPAPHAPFPSEDVCTELHQRYATRNVVVTLSEDGMLLSNRGKVGKVIPTAAREVFDVSGAGDTALASLSLALAAGANLETAAHFANAAAGVVVGKLGTATVTPEELVAYLKHT